MRTTSVEGIQAAVDVDLKPMKAADRLGLTTRQVRRLARRYVAHGPVGLISKRFNRPSNNRLDEDLADRVIKIRAEAMRKRTFQLTQEADI